MKKLKLDNGLTIIYEKKSQADISSFCIGFNSGAICEDEHEIGMAHALEHMVFKSTKCRNEKEINELTDKYFGFSNAMTNYPYVIYYGTTLAEDFEKGFELYSDIVLHPTFPQDGFKEEIDVICEELKEWKDDTYQYCEDQMLFNAFKKRRIKELIIGSEDDIKNITLEGLKHFYSKNYCANNCVISVVTSIDFDKVVAIIKKYFDKFKKNVSYEPREVLYEKNNPGLFYSVRNDMNGAKIKYCFDISGLSEYELSVLKVFNYKFGQGTGSILYDEIRTKNGLAYEISTEIKNERGIKLFVITMGTSEENIPRALEIIDEKINAIKLEEVFNEYFKDSEISDYCRMIRLKSELKYEKSIELAKGLTTFEIMYGSCEKIYDTPSNVHKKDIFNVIKKVLVAPTVQVVKPNK